MNSQHQKKCPLRVILDSGAVYLYNKYAKNNGKATMGSSFKDRKLTDYSYYRTPKFRKYMDSYIKYALKYGRFFTAYVNLDVINNAEQCYKSLKYMESKGCHPLPVYHIGCDVKWLKRYLKERYDYICLGGITPNRPEKVKPVLDKIWRDILTDQQGMPLVKVHGLFLL